MLKRRSFANPKTHESAQIRSPGHLAWVRGHCCAAESEACHGKIQAAHVRTGTDGGMGVKPSDRYAIPLCAGHHGEQHQCGETTFEQRHKINMLQLADDLWARSPHGRKWRMEKGE